MRKNEETVEVKLGKWKDPLGSPEEYHVRIYIDFDLRNRRLLSAVFPEAAANDRSVIYGALGVFWESMIRNRIMAELKKDTPDIAKVGLDDVAKFGKGKG